MIHPSNALLEVRAGTCQIVWRGNGDSCAKPTRLWRAHVAQEPQEDVAAERHANKRHRSVGRVVDDASKSHRRIARFAGVVGPLRKVESTIAGAKKEEIDSPSARCRFCEEATDVMRFCSTLEPVEEENARRGGGGWREASYRYIVAVFCGPSLRGYDWQWSAPDQLTPHGLEVRAGEPPRRCKGPVCHAGRLGHESPKIATEQNDW